jgi:hypothetical protein
LDVELAGALGQIHLGLLADDGGEAAADTLNGGEGEDDLLGTVDVGVEETDNVLEGGLLWNVKGLQNVGD